MGLVEDGTRKLVTRPLLTDEISAATTKSRTERRAGQVVVNGKQRDKREKIEEKEDTSEKGIES